MAGKKKKKRRSWLWNFMLFLVFLIGAGILFYPTVSDLWNNYRNQQLISEYTEVVETMESEDFSEIWAEAREYNAQHTVNTILDAFDEEEGDYVLSHPYDQVLNPTGNEIMGYLEIPKISVKLAIYHGIGTEALENGCGHIEGTSLPIGGVGPHSVLSAHRGLPSANLFYITVLDEKLAYKVDQILTVLPEETEDLAIEEDKDLVTLVTCTPYGVNSHRLLVRGERTEYVPEEDTSTPSMILRNPLEGTNRSERLLVIGLMVFIIFLILFGIILKIHDWRKRRKQRKREKSEEES